MNITIRKATIADVPQIRKLVEGLALFEKAPHEVTVSVEEFTRDGFGENAIYKSCVAETNGSIVGFCLFYTAYSTWKGKIVYLDDLFVEEAYRQYGIGKKLIDEVVKYAQEINANQVRWSVLEWNENAINFYKKLQVEFDAEWIVCRLNKQQINNYTV
jgi:ribosomal protein S18 acetylase RimI-like enzyme